MTAKKIYEQIKEANKWKTAVIIGGGLGGLFTGGDLSKGRLQVTVLEKNVTVGDGLQTLQPL